MFSRHLKNFLRRKARKLPDNVFALRVQNLEESLAIEVHGRVDTEISASIRDQGVWEIDETTLLVNALGKGQVFVDVGANIGYFSILASSLIGSEGKVLAFEPDPTNYSLLKKNTELNSSTNTQLFNLALSDSSSSGYLYLNENNLGDHQIFSDDELRNKIAIEIQRGDDIILPESGRADFIKIDTQGSEFHVLRGMQTLLRNSCQHMGMLLELTPNALIRNGVNPHHVVEFLEEFNFEFYCLFKARLVSCDLEQLETWINLTKMDPESIGFMNLLCCSPGFVPESGWPELPLAEIDLLDAMLGSLMPTWDGQSLAGIEIGKTVYLKRGWVRATDWGCPMNASSATITITPGLPNGKAERILLTLNLRDAQGDPVEPAEIFVNNQYVGTYTQGHPSVDFPISYFRREMATIRLQLPNFDATRPPPGLAAIEWRPAN